ncbi:hypothetical protein [Agrococcus sp. SGAir0287]|uniref:hypothetical protein n=1 Tax=Agrococcus sp. SGAir0287 TaxID=2070347 RepID=UPI0010CD612B|nr:hypothetical protein [Agrococcus sp. SGAir0287]QCR20449.1 hypothetical protein C1N71_14195 [Agrococcus sp. SGAir0287]
MSDDAIDALVAAIGAALDRLAATVRDLDDLDAPSRSSNASRRALLRGLATHLAHVTAALRSCHAPEAALTCTRTDEVLEGPALAATLVERSRQLRAAVRRAPAPAVAGSALRDELDAALARIEICHVGLDAGYDLPDLPERSLDACARVTDAAAQLRDLLPPRPRIRPTARRGPGIASPPGRRSS